MSVKHLASGSVEPPLTDGELRLYSMRFCPYAHRVHLTLNSKNIKYNPVFINLSDKPDWYLKRFPAGKVPSLVYNGEFLYGSLQLAEFLDEQYPNPPMYSRNPLQKIREKLTIESFDKVTGSFYPVAMNEYKKENFETFLADLTEFEKIFTERGSLYFGGENPGMVDFMIWPWFERFPALEIMGGDKYKIPETVYPSLMNWAKLFQKQEAVVKHYLTPEIHAKHFQLQRERSPIAFDFL